jgi:hypothetical protein
MYGPGVSPQGFEFRSLAACQLSDQLCFGWRPSPGHCGAWALAARLSINCLPASPQDEGDRSLFNGLRVRVGVATGTIAAGQDYKSIPAWDMGKGGRGAGAGAGLRQHRTIPPRAMGCA